MSKEPKKSLSKLEISKIKLQQEINNGKTIKTKSPHIYRFKIKTDDGHITKGLIKGYSKSSIYAFFMQDDVTVYELKRDDVADFIYGFVSPPKIKGKDLHFWLTGLSAYLKSGISLVEALKILQKQLEKKEAYNLAFQNIIYEIAMGEPFSQALKKQNDFVPPLLINMIKASEAMGNLEETLEEMANYYEEIDRTKKQMVSALTYPSVILCFAIVVVGFILSYVIPQFVSMYKQVGASLPKFTQMIINISSFWQKNGFNIILIMIALISLFYLCYKRIRNFRKFWQEISLHLPIIGNIIINKEMTIFASTFSSLLSNNVFITESIDLLGQVTSNEIYKEIMQETMNNIVKGEKISVSFKNQYAIPKVAYYMIETGERTGKLSEMMEKVSNYYQNEQKVKIGRLKDIIEPVMIVFLALIVGTIILAVIVPMYDVVNQIKL